MHAPAARAGDQPKGREPWADENNEDALFGREHEIALLKDRLSVPPCGTVMLLTGPVNEGKTYLLHHALVEHPEIAGLTHPAIIINSARSSNWSVYSVGCPGDLLYALEAGRLAWADRLVEMGKGLDWTEPSMVNLLEGKSPDGTWSLGLGPLDLMFHIYVEMMQRCGS